MTRTANIEIGVRVSYEDMANPLRAGNIVGETKSGETWLVRWDDGQPSAELDGVAFDATVTKTMLEGAVERQRAYRAERDGRGRCAGWAVDASDVTDRSDVDVSTATDVELADYYVEIKSHGMVDALVEADNEIAGRAKIDLDEIEQGPTVVALRAIEEWVEEHRTKHVELETYIVRDAGGFRKEVGRVLAHSPLDALSVYVASQGFARYDNDECIEGVSRYDDDVAVAVFTNTEIAAHRLRICTICKTNAIDSLDPRCDFCRICWATGASEERSLEQRGLLTTLRELDGVERVSVWQTGGGCMMLAIMLDDGRFIGTSNDNAIPDPGKGEKWTVVQVATSTDAWDVYDEAEITSSPDGIALDDDALVALIVSVVKNPGMPLEDLDLAAPDDDDEVSDELLRNAQDAFWAVVAAAHPEITTGDVDPLAAHLFDAATRDAIAQWVRNNR